MTKTVDKLERVNYFLKIRQLTEDISALDSNKIMDNFLITLNTFAIRSKDIPNDLQKSIDKTISLIIRNNEKEEIKEKKKHPLDEVLKPI